MCIKVQGAIIVILMSEGVGVGVTILTFTTKFFNVIGKALQGSYPDGSCMLTLLHSERSKLYTILAFLSAIGLILQ